jgi:hypothetical protein
LSCFEEIQKLPMDQRAATMAAVHSATSASDMRQAALDVVMGLRRLRELGEFFQGEADVLPVDDN